MISEERSEALIEAIQNGDQDALVGSWLAEVRADERRRTAEEIAQAIREWDGSWWTTDEAIGIAWSVGDRPLPDAAEGTGSKGSHDDPQRATATSDAVQGDPCGTPVEWRDQQPTSPGATDPRHAAAHRWATDVWPDDRPELAAMLIRFLAVADAVDPLRQSGMVCVDTRDEPLVDAWHRALTNGEDAYREDFLPDAAGKNRETDSHHDDPGLATPASGDAVQGDLVAPLLNGSDSSRPSPGASDPRVEDVLEDFCLLEHRDYYSGDHPCDVCRRYVTRILAAADAADRAAGIVRVDADRLTDALLKASETTDSTTLYPSWVEGYAGTLAERVLAELREANHD